MSEPVLVALLFADRVITEDNNKKAVIGIFNRVQSQSFPAGFPPWFIFASVTNLSGAHSFSLNLVHDETTSVVVPISGKLTAAKESDVVELSFCISKAIFPDAGSYTLTFNVDGMQVGSRILEASRAETSQ